jgi:hypothetical protein
MAQRNCEFAKGIETKEFIFFRKRNDDAQLQSGERAAVVGQLENPCLAPLSWINMESLMPLPKLSSTAVALYVVAALLAANLIATLARSDSPAILPAAFAQNRQGPIAGGGGLFVMPAQLSGNTWGAYLMDVDKGTLCVYQFFPGTRQLLLVASRKFTNDTRLENFNTSPTPGEVADLVEKQAKGIRVNQPPPADEVKPRDKDQ